MLSNLLGILLVSLGILILGSLFIILTMFAITLIRLIWAGCDKAVRDANNHKEKH